MNSIDKKGIQQSCIVACELMKQRLLNKNHATIQRSPNFCKDKSVDIQFKVKKSYSGVLIHFNLKNQSNTFYKGRYKIVDPSITTSEIIHAIWADIIPNIYKQYGVEIMENIYKE